MSEQEKWIKATLANDENSTDEEMFDYFVQNGVDEIERDLKRLDDNVEKCALAIGERFGECDEAMVRMADELLADVRRWAKELREYMEERAAEGETWEL